MINDIGDLLTNLLFATKKIIPVAIKQSIKDTIYALISIPKTKIYVFRLNKIISDHKKVKGYIIYPPTLDWDYMFQRPQQLARQFAKNGYLFFFCNKSYKSRGFKEVEPNIVTCGADTRKSLSAINDVIVYISWAGHINFFRKLKYTKLIYDYLDSLKVADSKGKGLFKKHIRLVANADLVLVTSDILHKKLLLEGRIKKTILVPNACDFKHFNIKKTINKNFEDINLIVNKNKPIIGYSGAFAEWFDYSLIKYCIKKRPNYEFVLLGATIGSSFHRSILDFPNVNYLGEKRYKVLPYYISCFDVAILPFKINDITRSTSPVKIFEYMASGKPVISTNLPECKKYKIILVSRGKKDFVNNIDRGLGLSRNKNYILKTQMLAKRNTWDKRFNLISKYL